MTVRKQLTKKQLAVIEDMLEGRIDENALLEKHRLDRRTYNKWLCDQLFKAEFDRRIEWLSRQSKAIIARYSSLAAAKLIQLTESESQETARKACMDIISLQENKKGSKPDQDSSGQDNIYHISPESAEKILAALAQSDADKTD